MEETDEERRRRLRREATDRYRSSPHGRAVRKRVSARWKAENRARNLLNQCKRRGCALTLGDVEALVAPMACSVTGVPLSWEWDGPGSNPWAPSIDRVDCSKGYEPGNVRLVCWAYNLARGAWPDGVFARLAASFVAHQTTEAGMRDARGAA